MAKRAVEEVDVYFVPSHQKTYCLSYFTHPKFRKMADDAELVDVKRKPLQHKVELEFKSSLGVTSEEPRAGLQDRGRLSAHL